MKQAKKISLTLQYSHLQIWFFLVQNFINQVFCGSYTIIKAKFKFCILQTCLKKEEKSVEEWSLDVITGLKNVVLQISVQREYAVPTFSYFKAWKYYIGYKKQENYL